MLIMVRQLYLLILLMSGLILYSGMAAMLSGGSMFARKANNTVLLTDFVNHYNASLLSRTCLSSHVNIYDPAVQAASQQKIIDPIKPDLPFYLQYPPYFFAMTLPLSVFNITIAFCIWTTVGMAALFACVIYILQETTLDKLTKVTAFLSVMVAYPTWLSFGMGQTSLFNFTAILLTLVLLRRNSPAVAGLTASLVAIKLQYAPLIALLGVMLGRIRFCLGFTLGLNALILYSVSILGLQNILAFPQSLFMGETSKHVSGVSPVTMQNLRGFLTLITHGQYPMVVNLIASAGYLVSLVIVCGLCRRYVQIERQPGLATDDKMSEFKMLTSLAIPILLLGSLHTHVYDYVMMAVPCIWLLDLTSLKPSGPEGRLLRVLIVIFPISSWIAAQYREQFNSIYVQPNTLWALSVLILAARIYFWKWHGAAGKEELYQRN